MAMGDYRAIKGPYIYYLCQFLHGGSQDYRADQRAVLPYTISSRTFVNGGWGEANMTIAELGGGEGGLGLL